jgi:mycothiol S-conjugate amidase
MTSHVDPRAPEPEEQPTDGPFRHCILAVHAHPDDESEFGAGTVARYHHEGVRTVLVCCTDGGAGRVRNPDVGPVDDSDGIVEIRREELRKAAAIVGYDEVVRLDYPDSGPVNRVERPESCFAEVPLDEPTAKVVEVIRRTRPQVVLTYVDDHRAYPHPDHIRTQEVVVRAFAAAAVPSAWPDAGPPWQPDKLYYILTSLERRLWVNARYAALGMNAPFSAAEDGGLQGRGDPTLAPPQSRVTTLVDVAPYVHVWIEGMRAHRCQLKPAMDRLLDIPPPLAEEIFGCEEFILARDLTGREQPHEIETDLFAGVR